MKWQRTDLQFSGASQIIMRSVWGSGDNDVYVCGHSSLGAQNGGLFRFDGKTWSAVQFLENEYGYLSEVTGFGVNDVWIAAAKLYWTSDLVNPIRDSAAVLHFDGTGWKQMLPSHFGASGLQSIWGTSSNNLFCGPLDGTILHFDGVEWTIDTSGLQIAVNTLGGDLSRGFAFGTTISGSGYDSVMWYERKSTFWERKDLQYISNYTLNPRFGISGAYCPVDGEYWSCGPQRVFKLDNSTWKSMLQVNGFFTDINGTSNSNMIVVGYRSDDNTGLISPMVFHSDGVTWNELPLAGIIPEGATLRSVWLTRREAIIVGSVSNRSFVLRGN